MGKDLLLYSVTNKTVEFWPLLWSYFKLINREVIPKTSAIHHVRIKRFLQRMTHFETSSETAVVQPKIK